MQGRASIGFVLAMLLPVSCSSDGSPTEKAEGGPGSEAAAPVDLTDVGSEGSLDYANEFFWTCRPDQKAATNYCYGDYDTTVIAPDLSLKVVRHERATAPAFDCFYVYPTVDLSGKGNMTDFADVGPVLDPLLSQGGRFSSLCEVYAPLYRQMSLAPAASGAVPTGEGASPELALQDVRDAFRYYLDHYNHGRKFVLIGHSQGTGMLTSMMKADIDDVPEIRSRLISALLIGGGFTNPPGKKTGGSLQSIPVCTSAGEVGCVIAYSTFDSSNPPGATSLFGKGSDALETTCVDPLLMAGNPSGVADGSVFPVSVNNPIFAGAQAAAPPGVTTPFFTYREAIAARCVKKDGFSYLETTLEKAPGDQRPDPPYRNPLVESTGFGLHIVDYNVVMDDLLTAVGKQATRAFE